MMETILTLISGIGWCIVYEECIRLGFRDKTCSMPFFALALNFAWEVIYFIGDGFFYWHGTYTGFPPIQILANGAWACLDVLILYTWFRHGKNHWYANANKTWFIPWSVLVIVLGFVIQGIFVIEFGGRMGSEYSAFLQNVIMSILFVTTLLQTGSTKGQSMLLAVAKWLGTLAPALLMGWVTEFQPYVLTMGILCSLFDILYIVMLKKRKTAWL